MKFIKTSWLFSRRSDSKICHRAAFPDEFSSIFLFVLARSGTKSYSYGWHNSSSSQLLKMLEMFKTGLFKPRKFIALDLLAAVRIIVIVLLIKLHHAKLYCSYIYYIIFYLY